MGLFSGIGAFELGLQQAGFNISAYCEIEEHCLKVLRKNFPNAEEFTDVKYLHPEYYDVMCGGFPCQDISIAGKNKGLLEGENSSLWRDYRNCIELGKPQYVIIENVSALLSRGLEIILQDLAEIGYDATWTTLDSKYFGVPQRRRRVYIVGVRDGIPEGTDLLQHKQRHTSNKKLTEELSTFDGSFQWDFKESSGKRDPFTFLTRQRSDQFSELGLSGTLAKRDWKSYTDLIVTKGGARKVMPIERLRLQGLPDDWWDGCGLTDKEKYTCNGMTVPVVKWLGECIKEFHDAR